MFFFSSLRFSVAKGRFFIENATGVTRHTLFDKSPDVLSTGFKYDKVCGASSVLNEVNNNNNNNISNNKGEGNGATVTVVCTKEQVKTVDVTKNDVERPVFIGWTFAVFEEIYFHEVSERFRGDTRWPWQFV